MRPSERRSRVRDGVLELGELGYIIGRGLQGRAIELGLRVDLDRQSLAPGSRGQGHDATVAEPDAAVCISLNVFRGEQ